MKRFLRKEKPRKWYQERVVWGLWTTRGLQEAYRMMAERLRVPISTLAGHVLRQWMAENYEILSNDEGTRNKFAENLVDEYLRKKDSE